MLYLRSRQYIISAMMFYRTFYFCVLFKILKLEPWCYGEVIIQYCLFVSGIFLNMYFSRSYYLGELVVSQHG